MRVRYQFKYETFHILKFWHLMNLLNIFKTRALTCFSIFPSLAIYVYILGV